MKKLYLSLIVILFLPNLAFSEEKEQEKIKDHFSYFSFGGGFPALLYGNFGLRVQSHHSGFDFGLGMSPRPLMCQAYFNYLFYPKPSYEAQWYLGLGSKAICYNPFMENYILLLPSYLCFGKEFISKKGNKRFFQVDLGGVYITEDYTVCCLYESLDENDDEIYCHVLKKLKLKLLPLVQLSFGTKF